MSRSKFSPARRFALFLLAAILTEPAHAADPAAADNGAPPIELPPVILSATRLPLPADEVASSVTVITADDLARTQRRTLAEALRDVPGLGVVQLGGPGQQASVYLRGTNANQVKILIDGIDVNDPSAPDGAFDFAHILTSDIERIEILRGPQSGLYGADAIGGVINIVTRKGSGPAKITGSVEGGSFATFNQTLGASGAVDWFDYAVDFAHLRSGDTVSTPSNLVAPGRPVNGDLYDNKTASTKLGAKLTDTLDLGLVARWVDTKLGFTQDDFLGPEALPTDGQTRQFFTRGTAHLVLFDGRFDQVLGVNYTDYRRRYFDPNPATLALGGDPNLYHGDRIDVNWQGNITVAPGQILTLGAAHRLDRINTSTPVTAQIANDSGYAQLQSHFGDRLYDTISVRYDSNQQFGSKATYRVAPAYLIPETGTKLKASVGTGFNPPALAELYANFPAFDFFANPNLKPETSIGWDAGFEQAFLNKRVQFGATYFDNHIDNLITLNDTVTSLINVGKAKTYGVESFVSYKPVKSLSLRADYTYTMAEDAVLHQELERRPKNKASLEADWQVNSDISLSATGLYTGSWVDVTRDGSATSVPVNGYTLVNLAGSYDFGDGITGFARIDNLLDRHYQDPLGFRHPGFGVFAGLRFALDPAQLAL